MGMVRHVKEGRRTRISRGRMCWPGISGVSVVAIAIRVFFEALAEA